MPTSLTKTDLQKALSGLATKKDLDGTKNVLDKKISDAINGLATKKDLDGTKKDLDRKIKEAVKDLPTKMDVNNMIDENFADFRLALNKDLEKFATKEDLERFATKEDVEEIVGKSKTELTSYIHEVADTIIDAFDSSYSEHLSKHHSKITIASIQ